MRKKLQTLITAIGLTAFLVAPGVLLTSTSAYAQTTVNPELCKGINYASNSEGDDCGDGEADESVRNIIQTIIDVASIIVGAVSVIMIIIGGLRYITSSGDSGNITAAKNTIVYAIVGLVIVIFAQTIVRFVVDRISGVE